MASVSELDGAVRPNKFFYKFFRRSSDNSRDMAVAAGLEPESFRITAPSSGGVRLNRIHLLMRDRGMSYDEFGGLAKKLAPKARFRVYDSGNNELLDFTDGDDLDDNADFSVYAGSDAQIQASGGSQEHMAVRFSVYMAGYPMVLYPGDYVEIWFREDLSGLDFFYALAQGIKL